MSWIEDLRQIWKDLAESRGDGGEEPDEERLDLYPYLHCSSPYYRIHRLPIPGGSRSIGSIHTERPGKFWNPRITVWNCGGGPAWSCWVEVLEKPGDIVKAQKVITLQPDEKRDVVLRVRTGSEGTSLVGVCYEPLLDPYEASGRKVTPLALVARVLPRSIHVGRTESMVEAIVNPTIRGIRRRGTG